MCDKRYDRAHARGVTARPSWSGKSAVSVATGDDFHPGTSARRAPHFSSERNNRRFSFVSRKSSDRIENDPPPAARPHLALDTIWAIMYFLSRLVAVVVKGRKSLFLRFLSKTQAVQVNRIFVPSRWTFRADQYS